MPSRHITIETVMAYGVAKGYGPVNQMLQDLQNGTRIILPNTKQARVTAQKHLRRVLRHIKQTAPGHHGHAIAGLPAKAYRGTGWWNSK